MIGGRTLIESVAAALETATSGIVVVAVEDGAYTDLGFETIGDIRPGLGPLGGLATALADLSVRHPGHEWLLLAACDLIEPDPSWVGLLARACSGASAVAFSGGGRWEPLFGLYHGGIERAVSRRIGSTDLSLHGLLDEVDAVAIPTPPGFRQANTPADLPG
jgi:molybdenum cofactor guanylyltransferase